MLTSAPFGNLVYPEQVPPKENWLERQAANTLGRVWSSYQTRFSVYRRIVDAVDAQGALVRDGKRLWPQTEHIKALAARGEREELRSTLGRVLTAYVDAESRGWHEQLDRAGRVVSDVMNATSVYHVVLALREAAARLA